MVLLECLLLAHQLMPRDEKCLTVTSWPQMTYENCGDQKTVEGGGCCPWRPFHMNVCRCNKQHLLPVNMELEPPLP